jgi:hypothetical protein
VCGWESTTEYPKGRKLTVTLGYQAHLHKLIVVGTVHELLQPPLPAHSGGHCTRDVPKVGNGCIYLGMTTDINGNQRKSTYINGTCAFMVLIPAHKSRT